MDCKHGTDTGERWHGCPCSRVICRCEARINQLREKVMRDAVDLHTEKEPGGDPYKGGYVYVRSRFCTPKTCSYFENLPPLT